MLSLQVIERLPRQLSIDRNSCEPVHIAFGLMALGLGSTATAWQLDKMMRREQGKPATLAQQLTLELWLLDNGLTVEGVVPLSVGLPEKLSATEQMMWAQFEPRYEAYRNAGRYKERTTLRHITVRILEKALGRPQTFVSAKVPVKDSEVTHSWALLGLYGSQTYCFDPCCGRDDKLLMMSTSQVAAALAPGESIRIISKS